MSWLDRLFGRQPRLVIAHAARAGKQVTEPAERVVSRFVTWRSADNKTLDFDRYFIVQADGNSLKHKGIDSKTRFLALRLDENSKMRLLPGSVVVINAPAKYSNVGRRLRVVDSLSGDTVTFETAPGEQSEHRSRPLSEIEGVITHSVD
jgi:hypothetical protein